MAELTVVAPPAMVTVANVELMHTGTWALSTGEVTFTVADLASAVAALDCPAVRRPILKFGHTPDPAPGQPAIGFVGNMATAQDGRMLVGDYVGMPGWLATPDADGHTVLSSAYPDRSIEGEFHFRCQLGHDHPFVVTAVSLLGTESPGIGTLQSLQDLADLYRVAAQSSATGTPVAIPIRASQEDRMPVPSATQVSAGVSTEDVRRAFYASPEGAGWSSWIEEIQLDPMQLIVMNDDMGTRCRVPVVIGDGDGEEAVTFGEAVKVVIRYDDAAVTASAGVVRFASRDESRPGKAPRKAPTAKATGRTEKGAGPMADSAKIREALGLGPDAPDGEVRAALVASGLVAAPTQEAEETPETEVEPELPKAKAKKPAASIAGTTAIDVDAWEASQKRIKTLEAKLAKQDRDERDKIIAQAIKDGKFAPARRELYASAWDKNPEGTREIIAGLLKNAVPMEEVGYGTDGSGEPDEDYLSLYPTKKGGN